MRASTFLRWLDDILAFFLLYAAMVLANDPLLRLPSDAAPSLPFCCLAKLRLPLVVVLPLPPAAACFFFRAARSFARFFGSFSFIASFLGSLTGVFAMFTFFLPFKASH